MTDIHIRHYEPTDLPQVHALYSEQLAFADTLQLPYQPAEHWVQKLETRRDGSMCLVALRGEELVGQLGLSVQTSPRRRHVADLGMGVKASARRSGVGSALLAAAVDSCENWLNVSRIEIGVYTDNAAALGLYQKHGFVIEGTCRRYAFRNGHYVDVHLMARISG